MSELKSRIRREEQWLKRRQEGLGTLTMLNSESYTNFLRIDHDTYKEMLSHVEDKVIENAPTSLKAFRRKTGACIFL